MHYLLLLLIIVTVKCNEILIMSANLNNSHKMANNLMYQDNFDNMDLNVHNNSITRHEIFKHHQWYHVTIIPYDILIGKQNHIIEKYFKTECNFRSIVIYFDDCNNENYILSQIKIISYIFGENIEKNIIIVENCRQSSIKHKIKNVYSDLVFINLNMEPCINTIWNQIANMQNSQYTCYEYHRLYSCQRVNSDYIIMALLIINIIMSMLIANYF